MKARKKPGPKRNPNGIPALAERYGIGAATLRRYLKAGVNISDPKAVALHASRNGRSRDTRSAPVMKYLADPEPEAKKTKRRKPGAPKGTPRRMNAAKKLADAVGANPADDESPLAVEARTRLAEMRIKERQAERAAIAIERERHAEQLEALKLARLDASLIEVEKVSEIAVSVVSAAKAVGQRILGDLPPRIEGMPAAKIQKIMADEFHKMWEELSNWDYIGEGGRTVDLGHGDSAKSAKRKRAAKKAARKRTKKK